MANIKLNVNDMKIDKVSRNINFNNKKSNLISKISEAIVIKILFELSQEVGLERLKRILEDFGKIEQVNNITKH